jgi:hypothetical protein
MVIGGFVVVVLISYVLASGTDVSIEEMAGRGIDTSETTIRRIGTGLNMFFLLVLIAIAAMVLGAFKNMSNK